MQTVLPQMNLSTTVMALFLSGCLKLERYSTIIITFWAHSFQINLLCEKNYYIICAGLIHFSDPGSEILLFFSPFCQQHSDLILILYMSPNSIELIVDMCHYVEVLNFTFPRHNSNDLKFRDLLINWILLYYIKLPVYTIPTFTVTQHVNHRPLIIDNISSSADSNRRWK